MLFHILHNAIEIRQIKSLSYGYGISFCIDSIGEELVDIEVFIPRATSLIEYNGIWIFRMFS